MRVIKYDFVTGIETASPPAASDPAADSDLVPYGFAQKNFARGVADAAALKAVTAAHRQADLPVFVTSLAAWYIFDSASTATGNDITVITPTDGTGRWLRNIKRTQLALTDGGSGLSVTGALFDKTKIRSVTIKYDVTRAAGAQSGILECVTDGTSWECVQLPAAALPSGTDIGILFSMNAAGQVLYDLTAGSTSKLSWKILDYTELEV